MSFKIKSFSERNTLSIRKRISTKELPDFFKYVYDSLNKYLQEHNAKPVGPLFAIYYNLDMQNLDIESGFPVTDLFQGENDIRAGRLPGGRAVIGIHKGPYSTIENTYQAMAKWMKEHNLEPTGMLYENYISDPDNTSPEDILTEIVFHVK